MTVSGDLQEFDATLDLLCGASSFELSFIQTQTVCPYDIATLNFFYRLILDIHAHHVCMNVNRRAERVRKVCHKMVSTKYWLA